MRRSFAVVLSGALCIALTTPAQAAVRPGWNVKIGIRMMAVASAPDGSIYAVGDRRKSITAQAFLTKFNADGKSLWTRAWLPNIDSSTNAVAVDLMPNGNVAWTGQVAQQCGDGWFVQVNRPNGTLVRRYVTPGWQCTIDEKVTDVAASADRIVVTGYTHSCCGDLLQDGFVQAFDATAHPVWRTNVEPPAPTPKAWFDRATGISMGAFGNLFVAGWAATRSIAGESSPTPGTMVLWKLTAGGAVLWSHRVGGVPMPSMSAPASVAARGDAVMVAAGVRGHDIGWPPGGPPTDGWLGRFTTGGSLVWSRHFDLENPRGAEPMSVAIDASGATWVVGTRRTVRNKGLDLFVRRYSAGGTSLGKASLSKGSRYLHGTGIAARFGGGAYVTGWVGNDIAKRGRLWRFFA
jgi:hypothetical protein